MPGRTTIPAVQVGLYGLRSQIPTTLGLAAALGSLEGARVVHLTGRRTAVSTEAEAWGGVAAAPYRPVIPVDEASRLLAAEPLTVVSSSVTDAFGVGGSQVVVVEYLNGAGYERVGLAVMSGTVPAPVLAARSVGFGNAQTYEISGGQVSALRVTRMIVVTGVAPVGNLTCSGTGGIMAYCQIGQALSRASRWVCPRGMVGIITGLGYGSDSATLGRVYIYAQPLGKPNYRFSVSEVSRGAFAAPIAEPIRVAALGAFGMTFEKDGGGPAVAVSCVLQPILLPDPSDPDPRPDLQPAPLG